MTEKTYESSLIIHYSARRNLNRILIICVALLGRISVTIMINSGRALAGLFGKREAIREATLDMQS